MPGYVRMFSLFNRSAMASILVPMGRISSTINDNMQLTAGYTSTINDSGSDDLKMDGFRVTLIFGWHRLIEGMHRMKGND
jgi:hypothetical protein